MTDKQLRQVGKIKSIGRWFNKPFLPVSKDTGDDFPLLGVIHEDNLHTVKRTNLFLLPLKKEDFDALPGDDYESVEELIADGWQVD